MVTDVFDKLRTSINNQEKQLIDKIRSIKETNHKRLNTYKGEIEEKQQKLSQQNQQFKDILAIKIDAKLLEMKKELNDSIDLVSKELEKLEIPILTKYQIKGIDRLQSQMDEMLKQIWILDQQGNAFNFIVICIEISKDVVIFQN
jgi:exonuclease VII large subunit